MTQAARLPADVPFPLRDELESGLQKVVSLLVSVFKVARNFLE